MSALDRQEAPAFAVTTVALAYESDVVLARRRARALARHLGFDLQQQVRFATAVSELARNAFQYGARGRVTFSVEPEGDRSLLVARVRDEGPGIADLDRVLAGTYVSSTGMGIGLTGARRLSDRFAVETAPGRGTTVTIAKVVAHARAPLLGADLARVAQALAREDSGSAFDEMQRQNQELLSALEQLERSNSELDRLNQELAETNRGVVALYTELDDRAAQLQLLSETKTRFLSDVSHELRTPLSSIVNLSRILLAGTDGPLSSEQAHQVSLVQRSAESLTEMVSDLLDLAKIEAGRVELRPDDFTVAALFAALRGMFRPLATNERVALLFEEPAEPIELYTDEQRIAQVLRNFVSNALKFTVDGEVRVSAERAGGMVRFIVADTGIGIDAADRQRIFQDFVQVDGPIQRRVRGTGLGLPLTAKLAAVLGGRVELESEVGVGSRFALVVPRDVRGAGAPHG